MKPADSFMHFIVPTCRFLNRLPGALLLVFALSLLVTAPVKATDNDVILVYQPDKSFSVSIANRIANGLRTQDIPTRLLGLRTLDTNLPQVLKRNSLIVSLGSEPTNRLLTMDIQNPVLSLLIPKQSHEKLMSNKTSNSPWASLFIDQPINRQLLLIKHLFGEDKSIGTLLGPYSVSERPMLRSTARKHGQELHIETINEIDQLIPALRSLTSTSDVMLALPDPVAFNRKTVRGILLLTYRENIPVIGFSKSYVKAGAIASLYSEYSQISDQAQTIIMDFVRTGGFDKKTYYPDNFSIAINRKVARTLNIRLMPRDLLIERIKRDEGSQ